MSIPTPPSSVKYGFRLKFHMPAGYAFAELRQTRLIRIKGVRGRIFLVKLRQQRRHRFGARVRYAFVGKRFESLAAAESCGIKLKQALQLFAAKERLGVDIGRGQATSEFSKMVKDAVAAKANVQLRDDIHGLDVYAEYPPVRRFGIEAHLSASRKIENYENALEQLFFGQRKLKEKEALALELYNLSHFEGTPQTRFLLLNTVIEVLAKRERKSPAVRAVIRDIKGRVVEDSTLTEEEKESVNDGLGYLQRDTISEACAAFIARYGDQEDVAFFKACYRTRSLLLHEGRLSDSDQINLARLDELVSKVLILALSF